MYRTFSIQGLRAEHLLQLASPFSDLRGTCLLYSGGAFDSSQFSYLALFPFETLSVYLNQTVHEKLGTIVTHKQANPWEGLIPLFESKDRLDYAFGYLSYEMGAWSDEEKLLPASVNDHPLAYWHRYTCVLVLEHATQMAKVILHEESLKNLAKELQNWIELLLKDPLSLVRRQEFFQQEPLQAVEKVNQPERKDTYLKKIEHIKELIRAGEIYQVNLSHQFVFNGKRDPFSLFKKMTCVNPAPFSAYFNTSCFKIVCTSPERFFKKIGSELETRPIKGTMPRGRSQIEDEYNKQILLSSEKESAELVMITDLMRNDLGRISIPGSVEVVELKRCEAYTNVFHLLSIIRSTLDPNISALQAVKSCFPGGSITGCPKLRAIEVIYDLEKRTRGVYTGSIGYIQGGGEWIDLNIAIRTLTMDSQGHMELQLGGGIVIDSDPELEYAETLAKGDSLFKVLNETSYG